MSKKLPALFAQLAFLGLTSFLMSCGSSSSRPSDVLYVLSQGENNIGYFAIDLNSGNPTLINKTTPTDTTPSSILLGPTGKTAFVLNTGSNTITSYTIGSDGTLTSAGPSTPIPVQNAVAMTRDAAGTFLLVVAQGTVPPPEMPPCPQPEPNTNCPALVVFTTQPGSGTLTQAGDPFALDRVPTSAAASITGTFNDPNNPAQVTGTLVHVTANFDLTSDNNSNTISEYVVQTAGAVTGPLVGSPYTTQSNPSSVLAVKTTPTGGSGGQFVYVSNVTTNNLDIFQLCIESNGGTCSPTDKLNAKLNVVGTPVSVGLNPVAMTVDPTNNFLYVVNHDASTVSSFRINPTTGALGALNPATVSTGARPVAIAMHSSGKFLFVSNSASSNISAFNADTTSGALSKATNVTSTAQPAGLAVR